MSKSAVNWELPSLDGKSWKMPPRTRILSGIYGTKSWGGQNVKNGVLTGFCADQNVKKQGCYEIFKNGHDGL